VTTQSRVSKFPSAMAATSATPFTDDDNFEQAKRNFKNQYEISEVLLGEGTYGKVLKARCRQTGLWRAMKQMKLGTSSEEGVPSTAIREVAILKELSHDNIVQLLDVFCKPGELILVFELLDSDLKKHMKSLGGKLQPTQVRDFSQQLLTGIEFCHANRIIHRDLKPQNLLIETSTLRLKIADFGLARAFTLPVPQYTHEVVTVWYRPLEILLGSKLYSLPVDLWGVGCIIAEMATGAALFAGDSEIDTALKSFKSLGRPQRQFGQEFPSCQTSSQHSRNGRIRVGQTFVTPKHSWGLWVSSCWTSSCATTRKHVSLHEPPSSMHTSHSEYSAHTAKRQMTLGPTMCRICKDVTRHVWHAQWWQPLARM